MPSFRNSARTPAAPEEVWKVLYDPARFPDWWFGVGTVQTDAAGDGEERRYTMYPEGYPDFPMPQLLTTSRHDGRVVVSCLVSDLRFEWRLEPDGGGTCISVDVELPQDEAHRLDSQRDVIRASLARLAKLSCAPSGTA